MERWEGMAGGIEYLHALRRRRMEVQSSMQRVGEQIR
jgi:hypothetical protein